MTREDAISREDALKCFEEFHQTETLAVGYIRSRIRQLPSVTSGRHKGHWIYDETLENWRCSKCNETPKIMGYVGTADFMTEHFKFCNHCGAKMVEPQESEE